MSEDPKKKPTPRNPLLAALESPDEGIRVRYLVFARPNGVDMPGRPAAAAITCAPPPENPSEPSLFAGRYEATFLPKVRHHRITWIPSDDKKSRVTTFVHEAQIARWEPLEQ